MKKKSEATLFIGEPCLYLLLVDSEGGGAIQRFMHGVTSEALEKTII